MKIWNLLFIFFLLNLYSQEGSKRTDLTSVVNAIKSKKELRIFHSKNQNYFLKDTLFNQLQESASEKQILEFTNDTNGILRIYSFMVLCDKYKDKCYDLILKNLHNYTTFHVVSGCVINYDYTTDFWIYLVTSEGWQSGFKLEQKQKNELNNLLIRDKSSKLRSHYFALREIETSPENYELIKKLVTNDKNGIALYLLAEYQKPEDIAIISSFNNKINYLDDFLKAIENFPNIAFYQYVLKAIEQEKKYDLFYSDSNWNRILITLAKYPTLQTKKIFEDLLKESNNERLSGMSKGILLAITKNPNPIFDSIKSQIPVSEDEMLEINNQIELYNYK